ncbi:MAG: hypothetical protein LC109_11245, partial [Bacteroidia bacterium]|nr:hypothetical protein [Bacteroidia bacterium]
MRNHPQNTDQNRYPFGMSMMGYSNEEFAYMYKHQGQESDDEVYGDGAAYFYTYRMSDSRYGRFWSVDPLESKYPHNSVYAYSENRVIASIELEGLEAWDVSGGATYGPFANQEQAQSAVDNGNTELHIILPEATVSGAKPTFAEMLNARLENPDVRLMVLGLSTVGNQLYGERYRPWEILTLTEEEKQKIFESDASKTLGILMSEFVEGHGQETRYFTLNTPISIAIRNSYTTSLFLQYLSQGIQSGVFENDANYSITIFTSPDNSDQNPPGLPGA